MSWIIKEAQPGEWELPRVARKVGRTEETNASNSEYEAGSQATRTRSLGRRRAVDGGGGESGEGYHRQENIMA